MPEQTDNTITEVTRRNIMDAITVEGIRWSGRMSEQDFLSRLYDLKQMPSTDGRYNTAYNDIWKHREMNRDWDDDWVFHDPRFGLFHGPDEPFLHFLCETVHPAVRLDEDDVAHLVEIYTRYLTLDGWEIVPRSEISGRPVFSARRRIKGVGRAVDEAKEMADALSADYIAQQITRMETAIDRDPELAIGTAKEFVETICKTILKRRNIRAFAKNIPHMDLRDYE